MTKNYYMVEYQTTKWFGLKDYTDYLRFAGETTDEIYGKALDAGINPRNILRILRFVEGGYVQEWPIEDYSNTIAGRKLPPNIVR